MHENSFAYKFDGSFIPYTQDIKSQDRSEINEIRITQNEQ